MPTIPKNSKYTVNFQDWILGGSLLSVTSTESDTRRRRSSSRKVAIAEVDSDGNEITASKTQFVKDKMDGRGKNAEAKPESKENPKVEEKKKDADAGITNESKPKKKCKCGNEIDGLSSHNEDKSNDGGYKTKKPDEEKKSEGKTVSGGGGWTDEQDAKIKEMKGEDKSWKDIAAAVGASKSHVQKRFKELQHPETKEKASGSGEGQGVEISGENGGVDEAGTGELDFGSLFDAFGNNNTGGSGWGGGGGSGWAGADDTVKDAGNDNSWDGPQVQEPEKSMENNNNRSNKQNGRNKDKGGGNTGGSNQTSWNGGTQSNSWNDGAKEDTNKCCDAPNDDQSSLPQEECHRRLQANDIWSRDDCEILEMLEERYREHKWLHIQAEFFNWTGRMITSELIEKKFMDDGAA